ncbi:AbrB/MazE/SpoVT family DNA-binding domain-containing protein [Candidatus Woesearchaeota archaeon]|nr:AbrB/MazE/SpoVT family DNA-binding domain-containing protein [Candidatus Woesearchaeota archaeon]
MTEIETAKMSERGQIIIPKEVRDYIGAGESTIFTIMPLDRETIIMKKLDKMKVIQEFRSIRTRVKEKLTQKEINQEIGEVRKSR